MTEFWDFLRFDGEQPLIDDMRPTKYETLRDFLTELMLDVREDGFDCGCRACQRIRRATRALESDASPRSDANRKDER